MENKQYIVSLEISSSKIVGVLVEKQIPSGNIIVSAIETEKIINCVRYGCIQNIEEVKNRIRQIIKKLENHLSFCKIKSVYVGVNGRSVRNATSETHHHYLEETSINEQAIRTLIEDARKIPYEGLEILDILPCKYIVDKAETKNPVGCIATDINATVNIILGRPILKSYLRRVIDEPVEIAGFIVSPLAVADEILSDNERQVGCMLVDFGAETTTVSIYKNGALQYLSTIPLGSRSITRDIMNLNVVEERAEELKCNVGSAVENESAMDLGEINVSDVTKYTIARSGEIVANIVEQLNYAGVNADDLAEGIILIGGGAELKGFAELLERSIKIKVKHGQYPSHVNIIGLRSSSSLYISAVAIAAKAAELAPQGMSCIERQVSTMPPADTTVPTDTKKPAGNTERKPQKPSKFGSLFNRLKQNVENVFTENDKDGDDDE